MTDSLTQVLAHLRRLLADATPGPWRDPGNGNVVGPSGLITTVPRGKGAGASRRRDADAALICAAISHLPRLLAEVERGREETAEAVRAERERCMNAVAATYGPWRTNWTPDENLRAWKDATIEAIQSGGGPQP